MPEDDSLERDLVIPVVQESVNVDATPVVTGGVRVTKRVESNDEVIEQQLRTSHADVKRVKVNRVVDGPQAARREGDTLIIPVVSEVLKIEKQWVVTEEIHITQRQELETVQQTVPVNYEQAVIERVDEEGTAEPAQNVPVQRAGSPNSILDRTAAAATAGRGAPLSGTRSLLANKNPKTR